MFRVNAVPTTTSDIILGTGDDGQNVYSECEMLHGRRRRRFALVVRLLSSSWCVALLSGLKLFHQSVCRSSFAFASNVLLTKQQTAYYRYHHYIYGIRLCCMSLSTIWLSFAISCSEAIGHTATNSMANSGGRPHSHRQSSIPCLRLLDFLLVQTRF